MSTHSSPPSLPTYSVKTYSPDNGFTTGGLLMFLASLAAVGALLGYAAFWVHKIFWIVLFFPMFIGFIIGAAATRMAKRSHIRNPWIGGLAGFLAGTFAMTTLHYFDYDDFRSHLATLPKEIHDLATQPEPQRNRIISEIQNQDLRIDIRETIDLIQINTFPKFMDHKARLGVSIKGKGRGDGMNLGYTGSWIYWAVELLLVAGITFGMVFESTAQPYCPGCQRWKNPKTVALHTDPHQSAAALKRGDLTPILAAKDSIDARNLRLTAAACDTCAGQSPIDLKLESLTYDKQGAEQTKTLAHVTYPPEALPALAPLFVAAPPSSPAPPSPAATPA